RTLWDWLQLLIIPLVLAIGGFWLNQLQKDRELKESERRTKLEQDTAEKRAQTEREAAEKHVQAEREVALDNQREAALQDYIDKMSELLIHEKLRESAKLDEIVTIARVRTLTVLPRLDARRKKSLLEFLYAARLI